jgi:hypothetical protein
MLLIINKRREDGDNEGVNAGMPTVIKSLVTLLAGIVDWVTHRFDKARGW